MDGVEPDEEQDSPEDELVSKCTEVAHPEVRFELCELCGRQERNRKLMDLVAPREVSPAAAEPPAPGLDLLLSAVAACARVVHARFQSDQAAGFRDLRFMDAQACDRAYVLEPLAVPDQVVDTGGDEHLVGIGRERRQVRDELLRTGDVLDVNGIRDRLADVLYLRREHQPESGRDNHRSGE